MFVLFLFELLALYDDDYDDDYEGKAADYDAGDRAAAQLGLFFLDRCEDRIRSGCIAGREYN